MKYILENVNTLESYYCNELRTLWRIVMRHRKDCHEFNIRPDTWKLGLTGPDGRKQGRSFAEIPGGFSNCVHIVHPDGKGKYFIL